MNNPRDVVPESIMPAYPWLEKTIVDDTIIQKKMEVLRTVGLPYTDKQIESAQKEVEGKTELDALIEYLQVLGTAVKTRR
jgi:cytochrome c oxidase cbb3-type subunit 2